MPKAQASIPVQTAQVWGESARAWLQRVSPLVRAFIPADSISKPRAFTLPEGDEPVAYIRWGGPSEFGLEEFRAKASGGVKIGNEDDEEEELPSVVYSETARNVSEVRITNPEDADQYVIVERVESIHFSGPNGGFTLNFRG